MSTAGISDRRRARRATSVAPPSVDARVVVTVAAFALAGCEYRPGNARSGDTAVPSVAAADSATLTSVAGDTGALRNVTVPPIDSVPTLAVSPSPTPIAAARTGVDTGTVRLFPDQPQRGDVIFALVQRPSGASSDTAAAGDEARCRWGGRPLPCRTTADGVLALLPVSADDTAGTYEFAVDGVGGRRITRRIAVDERDLGRETIFLRRDVLARARSADAARDARALRAVLAAGSPDRRWRGAWREPVSGASVARASGYGAERFYFSTADSSRVAGSTPTARMRGAFAVDTGTLGAGDVPAWRHAGVDLSVGRGTSVRAPAAGQVADVGEYALTGRTVVVDHGDGVMTAYFHLDSAAVRRGAVVQTGQPLGRVGATGLATGPHLHFGVYVHGRDVDPAAWYRMPSWVVGSP